MNEYPAGTYRVKPTEQPYTTEIGQKNTPAIVIEAQPIELIDGENIQQVPSDAKTIEIILYTTTDALKGTIGRLKSLGFNGNIESPEIAGEFFMNGFMATCKHEMWNDRARAKWSLGGGGLSRCKWSQSDKDRFSQAWIESGGDVADTLPI